MQCLVKIIKVKNKSYPSYYDEVIDTYKQGNVEDGVGRRIENAEGFS